MIPWKACFLATIGVLLACLAFPKFNQFYTIYATLAFFTAAIYQFKSWKEALICGLLLSTIAGSISFNFVTHTVMIFGGFPLPLALLVQFFFNFICEPHFYLFFILGFFLRSHIDRLPLCLRPLFWAVFYTSLEFAFRDIKIFMDSFGGSQVHWLPLAQFASIGGVTSISFFIAISGTSLFYLVKSKHWQSFAATVLLLLTVHFWGQHRIDSFTNPPHKIVKFAMVQGNTEEIGLAVQKLGRTTALNREVQTYIDLSKQAPDADMVIWPETAYPFVFPMKERDAASLSGRFWANELRKFVAKSNQALLFGAYTRSKNKEYNSAVLIDERGFPLSRFAKKHLLVFGEYMPLGETFPAIKKLNPMLGDFGRGPGPVPQKWPAQNLLIGTNICYEELYSDFMRDLANNGAHFYLNLTKDSWFGDTSEPLHHLQLSIWRSIENAKPLVRSTNTGYTAYVDHLGRVTKRSKLFEQTVLQENVLVPYPAVTTFFQRWGDWFAWLNVLVCGLLIGVSFFPFVRVNH